MTRTPIRTAVLGYGLAGRVFHCPFVSAVPGLELTAIVSTGTAAPAAYPNARILPTPQAAFEDPTIDLIVVGTPNPTHVEFASAALQAGKHVVVDKPMAPSSTEANELIDLGARYGRVLAPFHNRRFDSDFLTVKKLMAEGKLGRITQVISHFDRYRPLMRPNSWKEDSGPASGLLFDLGPHLLDQAIALFGTPTHITGSVRSDRDETLIDDAFDITLEFQVNGHTLLYECHATMLAAEPSPRFLLHGTEGSFTKFGLDPQEAALIAGKRPPMMESHYADSEKSWIMEPEATWGVLTSAIERKEPVKVERSDYPSAPGDYRHFYASVRDAINGDAALAVPASAGYRTIRLIELAIQSSKERRTLEVAF